MTTFWEELKRRKVVRVAIAYAIVAWLLLQVADVVLDNIEAPAWIFQVILLLLLIGFPLAIILAWAFDLTPEGIRKEKHLDRSEPNTPATGRKLEFTIIAVLLVAALGGFWWFADSQSGVSESIVTETQSRKMIAVLPFSNVGGDPTQDFFVDGMTEEMIVVLGSAQPDALGVIALTSAIQFRARNATIETIGDALHVDYVLEASVRRQENQVRITATLIQVADQSQLWGESFNGTLDDIFGLQNDIANRIAEALAVELLLTSPIVVGSYNPEPAAYDAYLNGRFSARRPTSQRWRQAIEHYESAVALDPDFAAAHAGLADAYVNNATFGGESASVAYPKAKYAADEALRLNPALAEAHAAQALVKLFFEWDWDAAEASFRHALTLNPSNAQALHHFGHYLDFRGRPQESLEAFANSLALDPLSAFEWTGQAYTLVNMGEFERAGIVLDRALELDSELPMRWLVLGMLREGQGDFVEAAIAWEHAVSLDGDVYYQRAMVGYAYARTGRIDEAKAVLDNLARTSPPGVGAMHRATIFAGLGDFDSAFRLLEQAIADREPWIIGLRIDAGFSQLENDPRFADILELAGISD